MRIVYLYIQHLFLQGIIQILPIDRIVTVSYSMVLK